MKAHPLLLAILATLVCTVSQASGAPPANSADRKIPDLLKPWENWATWDDKDLNCPRPYMDGKKPLCQWPSRLALTVDKSGGHFSFGTTVFAETWVALPGGITTWPLEVKANTQPVPVVEHQGKPSVHLTSGTWAIEGVYQWKEIPQSLALGTEIGLLSLTLEGKLVDSPAWDANGLLWLKRDASTEETDKDFISVKLHGLLEDGIPLWLRTQVELIVSGKSREEELGDILPAGWKLSAVESPIPVAIDDAGRMKAQVRSGKWIVTATAFRIDNPAEFRFAPGTKLAVKEELIAFHSSPDFRMVDLVGPAPIDVSQTSFPAQWHQFPVYRWDTATPFAIKERMRGMGMQKPEGLKIDREWWLDEGGGGFTFRDRINGQMQQIWRLDAAAGQDLGSVRGFDGKGQLITRNPQNGAPGVEIRSRYVVLDATGRMKQSREIAATGWRCDAGSVSVKLNLPPGWRLFALFGADSVAGDWLTAWTLLDLFLLLLFTLAVGRLWGALAGVAAFLAFGLAYHEPEAPRYVWLILLMPLALLRHVPTGRGHQIVLAWKWLMLVVLVLILAPFLAGQIQQVLYPQLENQLHGRFTTMQSSIEPPDFSGGSVASSNSMKASSGPKAPGRYIDASNLNYDPKARIQTGPGVPEWKWREVGFSWNGPVTATQQVHPILIPPQVNRAITAVRILLLLLLTAILLGARRWGLRGFGKVAKVAVLICACCGAFATPAHAELPDQEMLSTLRTRLNEISDAYPTAADIPSVSLALAGRRLSLDAEIHAAIRTAVPLPCRLSGLSPVTVLVDNKPESPIRRADGYLWVVLSEGIHRVHLAGLLAEVTEWEWTFQLKPHRVRIDAPGWNFSGVRPDGTPEQQIFFTLQQKSTAAQASYERQDYQSLAVVDRNLELGLIWQVHTTVTRLSTDGKAIALRIPLLPGENVLTSNAILRDGLIEVRMGARQQSFSWDSELPLTPEIKLATKPTDPWVERWHLVASPVWNVAISGLNPVFEPTSADLVPVWHPWPGESAQLTLSRPQAIPGATVTIRKVKHEVELGQRQCTSKLDLTVASSLAEDFKIELPSDVEITSLVHAGKAVPVRQDGGKLVVPLRPGDQAISLAWKTNRLLEVRATAGKVQLPTESANVETVVNVPNDRWVLWAYGPQQGPAVRFWGILICSLLAGWALGRTAHSPLRAVEWMLLALGLTQVPLPAALIVIGWFYFLAWRGRESFPPSRHSAFIFLQVCLLGVTAIALGVLVTVVGEGLLGNPDMFILGNGSSPWSLIWYQARSGALLPEPGCFSVSVWWFRLFMLLWALWLASSLIRWLQWGWAQFSKGGCFRRQSAP